MENIVLIIHLLVALAMIISVLLQRSEGGGLGIGGGGGGAASGRPPASPMAKFTWILALAFIATSLTLTWFATQNASGNSVIDRIGIELPGDEDGGGVSLPPELGDDLSLPPTGDGPLVPPSE